MIPLEDECLAEATLKPIRILAKVDNIWILDPNPNVVHPWWDLWVVGKKPLCELEWDLGNGCGYLHHKLGRMLGLLHFLNIRFDWEGRCYDIGYLIGGQ